MGAQTMQRLDIGPTWERFNESLIRLVDYVPEDQLNWSPKPELWNFRGIMLHIAASRDGWLGGTEAGADAHGTVNDGFSDVWQTVRSKDQIKAAYARTWARMAAFLADPKRLDATYHDAGYAKPVTGHWIAFHLLEHDVHHRADLMHYLALLDIETPDVGTP